MKNLIIYGGVFGVTLWLIGSGIADNAVSAFLLAGIIPGTRIQLPWFIMLAGAVALPLCIIITPIVIGAYRRYAHGVMVNALLASRLPA